MGSKKFWQLLIVVLLIGIISSFLAGCGSEEKPATAPAEQNQVEAPAEEPQVEAPEADASEAEAPEEDTQQAAPAAAAPDGKTLLEERCTSCHSLEKATSGERDLAGWQTIVDEMIQKGAKLNEEEAQILAEYLANLN